MCSRLVFCGLLLLNVLNAQVTTAVIVGTITDSTGGTVPNAKIVARAVATNQTREITTTSDGEYILTNLPEANTRLPVPPPDSARKLVKESFCRSRTGRDSI